MTDKPILFSGPMVRSLLGGAKTQTRRVLKYVNPDWRLKNVKGFDATFYTGTAFENHKIPHQEGDRLWVRETFCWGANDKFGAEDFPIYRANYSGPGDTSWKLFKPWKPSIYMPRRASRITLVVTDVRVQRLQGITDSDAMAEGVKPMANQPEPHTASFADLWNDINAKRGFGWEENPWVVAYTFTAHEHNIDSMEAS